MRYAFFMMVCLSIAITHFNVQAQDVSLKGKWMLGGALGYSSQSSQVKTSNFPGAKDESKSFSFSPMVGYFTSDQWQVGAKVILINFNNEGQTPQKSYGTSKGIELYMRHYTWMFDHFAFFVESGMRYEKNDQVQEYAAIILPLPPPIIRHETGNNRFGVYLQPGFTLLVNKRIGVDFTTRFFSVFTEKGTYYDQASDTTREYQNFNAQLSGFSNLLNNVQIGITIFI